MNDNNVFLIIPGVGNSDELHWQTLWEGEFDNFIRIQQNDWTNPISSDWVKNIEEAVTRNSNKQIYLVAHSLGCIAVAQWANKTNQNIAGALLVAPPDIEKPDLRGIFSSFSPVPKMELPFQSIVVASKNDEYASIYKAWQYAKWWGSEFINVGKKGHINSKSRIGFWPEGLSYINLLLQKSQSLKYQNA